MEKVITESTKIYPRGRGKILVISEKQVQPKPKNKKQNPSFLHTIIKSNPENIKVKEYMNEEIKRIILFPEGRILTAEERLELACSLLITLPKSYQRPLVPKGMRYPSFFTREMRQICKLKWKRYRRWRNRLQ